MQIQKGAVAAFHYQLFEGDSILEDSMDQGQQVLYLHGHNNLLPGVESALEGKSAGDTLEVTLPPDQAYGDRNEAATQRVPLKHVIKDSTRGNAPPKAGTIVQINTSEGPREVVVLKAGRFNIDVDTNHPFAGKTLRFSIHVGEVREATEEEIAHGHAHGDGGHSH